jgi:hypothetical protein
MDAWAAAFAPHAIPVAQILLTREDIDGRTRFLNLRNTVHAVHEYGAVPILNENDTISTDELVKISFGDNDILAALVTHALRADVLCLLTVVDGVLDEAGQPETADRAGGRRAVARPDRQERARQGRDELEAERRPDGDRQRRGDDRRPRADGERPAPAAGRRAARHAVRPRRRKRIGKNRWIGAARRPASSTSTTGRPRRWPTRTAACCRPASRRSRARSSGAT